MSQPLCLYYRKNGVDDKQDEVINHHILLEPIYGEVLSVRIGKEDKIVINKITITHKQVLQITNLLRIINSVKNRIINLITKIPVIVKIILQEKVLIGNVTSRIVKIKNRLDPLLKSRLPVSHKISLLKLIKRVKEKKKLLPK